MLISANRKLPLISLFALSAVTPGRIGSGRIRRAQNKPEEGELAGGTEKCLHLKGYLEPPVYTGSLLSHRETGIFQTGVKCSSPFRSTASAREPSKHKPSKCESDIRSGCSSMDTAGPQAGFRPGLLLHKVFSASRTPWFTVSLRKLRHFTACFVFLPTGN